MPRHRDQRIPETAELDEEKARAERRELFGTIDRYIVKTYGERCPDAQGGCYNCMAWAARDALYASLYE